MTTPTHSIVYRPVAEIHELEGNPRVIKKDQFEKLKTSIKNITFIPIFKNINQK